MLISKTETIVSLYLIFTKTFKSLVLHHVSM